VEGHDGGVDTEQSVSAQYFRIPVLEIEGFMRGCGRGVADGMLVIRGVCDGGIDGRLVIGGICDREVGERGDADGGRLNDGRCRNRVCLWDNDWLETLVRKPQRCGNGSCSGVFPVRASRL
jgi:hypothetical protein